MRHKGDVRDGDTACAAASTGRRRGEQHEVREAWARDDGPLNIHDLDTNTALRRVAR